MEKWRREERSLLRHFWLRALVHVTHYIAKGQNKVMHWMPPLSRWVMNYKVFPQWRHSRYIEEFANFPLQMTDLCNIFWLCNIARPHTVCSWSITFYPKGFITCSHKPGFNHYGHMTTLTKMFLRARDNKAMQLLRDDVMQKAKGRNCVQWMWDRVLKQSAKCYTNTIESFKTDVI